MSFLNPLFVNNTTTTELYTLSHTTLFRSDTEPNKTRGVTYVDRLTRQVKEVRGKAVILCAQALESTRSEEHTSELQSHVKLVCRLLLEKKKKIRLPRSSW